METKRKLFVFMLLSVFSTQAYTALVAPKSVGQPWPMPQTYMPTPDVQLLDRYDFQFSVVGQNCDILQDAIRRYYLIIFNEEKETSLKFRPSRKHQAAVKVDKLDTLQIDVRNPCEALPSLEMDESYELTITSGSSSLTANSIWGALRGLETFSQITYESDFGSYLVNNTKIIDAPRFAHRGVLLDTSRHFIHKSIIMQNLEAMAYNKMNVFHWHIVDDNSFPYESRDYPDMSVKGAFDPYSHVYTQADVAEVIEFARMRGIRVVPEFDTPGHSQSWGKSQPDLLTKCFSKGAFDGTFGPIDPTVNTTYDFLKGFMKELTEVFPDKYLHLGGDEVSFACWKSNPDITKFMAAMKYGTDYSKLEQYYEQQLLDIVGSYGSEYIVWQEVVDNGVKVLPDTVVEVWKGGQEEELDKVTKLGLRTILSSCWYLNDISFGSDWTKYYQCDPQTFNGTEDQKKLVIGGEMCMWGEFVDGANVISRSWPRGSAVAERLWSPKSYTSTGAAAPRLEEHRCRMIRRGLDVEPVNGPGMCRHEFEIPIDKLL